MESKVREIEPTGEHVFRSFLVREEADEAINSVKSIWLSVGDQFTKGNESFKVIGFVAHAVSKTNFCIVDAYVASAVKVEETPVWLL